MDAMHQYGLYLAQTITWLLALLVLTAGITAIVSKDKGNGKSKLKIKNLNKKFQAMRKQLQKEILSKKELKSLHKADKKVAKQADDKKPRLFLFEFKGDIKASAVENLRECVTALLSVAEPKDEIVVTIDSGGGMVHSYGLAASQLQRIRDKGIKLTVCIDKVAASGGYLMACVADKIVAAPFAIVGSIGVVTQFPNFHRLLKKNDIDYEQVTAGEHKRTLTLFGENTDKARQKVQEDLEEIHGLFKDHIQAHRAQIDMSKVATGEVWLGSKAFDLNLVDRISTSDDYLIKNSELCDIYEVSYETKKRLPEKLYGSASALVDAVYDRFLVKQQRPYL